MKANLDFGQVLKALKEGKLVARKNWEYKFIFMRPADVIHIDTVIDKVKSLPQSVKDYYSLDVLDEKGCRVFPAEEEDKITFHAYICMKDDNGTIVNGWLPSQSDLFAKDWEIVD